MIELLGIPVSATRRKCALLNLKVVRGAVTGDHAWPPDVALISYAATSPHIPTRLARPRYNS